MGLFRDFHVRNILEQGAAQVGTDDERGLIRTALLHPRAFRTAHELIEQHVEQSLTSDDLTAMTTAVGFGSLQTLLQWVLNNWATVMADIAAALKLFGLLK
jgi:hypothetical protein